MSQDQIAIAAKLIPLTDEARRALGGQADVRFTELPFKVGRESRSPIIAAKMAAVADRRLGQIPPMNDLYLLEPSSPEGYYISRAHFLIERVKSKFVLTDRVSTWGTWVGDHALGTNADDVQTELRDGDVIVIGTRHSPYRYQFRICTD